MKGMEAGHEAPNANAYSALDGVGLTAAVVSTLAQRAIPRNLVLQRGW